MNAPKLNNNHDDKFRGFKSFKEASEEGYFYNIIPREVQTFLRYRYGLKSGLKQQLMEELISIGDGFAPSEKEMCFRLGCYPQKYHEAVADLIKDGYIRRDYNDTLEANVLTIQWDKLWNDTDTFSADLAAYKKTHSPKEPFKWQVT